MILKSCEYCNKNIRTKFSIKRFCNNICQRKHYNRRPEIKEKCRIRIKNYRRNNPEWKEKHRILAATKYREKRREYWRNYGKRPEIRIRINEKEKTRRQIDVKFAITDRLRRSLNHALSKYSKTGKIMNSKKYGINWEEIMEGLKPFPENLRNFEIDHIIPLHIFDLTNPKKVKEAFSPSNLQWLTREENRKKGGKILKDLSLSNNMILSTKSGEIK